MSSRKKITLAQGGTPNTNKVDSKYHYVDNAQFYEELKAYLIKRKDLEKANLPTPIIPNSIGRNFEKIADYMSRKPNFVGYSYKDEMKADAVMNMCNYIAKFDWEKWNNPFAYFSQCCFYSFTLMIKKEKKQSLVKASVVNSLGTLLDDLVLELQDEDTHFKNTAIELLQLRSSDILASHEEGLKNKRKQKKSEIIEDDIDSLESEIEFDSTDIEIDE